MTDTTVLDIVGQALMVAMKLAGPILLVSLVLGVAVSLLQTITQVQEATLTFVPKLVGTAVVVMIGGSWMLHQLTDWVEVLWTRIPEMV